MKNKTLEKLPLENGEEILASHDFNDDRTVAFHSIRKKHKKDAIGWIIGGLLLFFFTLISLGRITIIGQFFDDSIFNLIFGWFKFPIYLVLLVFNICIYLGVHFKFKKRFLLMVGLTSVLLCWIISLALLTSIYDQQKNIGGYTVNGLWSKDMLKNGFNIYWFNWLEHSIYAGDYAKTDKMELLISDRGYVNLYAGGGIIGTFLATISAYLSIPVAFILVSFLFFLNSCWLFTGDPLFFFKSRDKRKGHALRILSLKGRNNPNKKDKNKKNVSTNSDYQIWKSLNVFDPNVEKEMESSDLTIKMPSYNLEEKGMNLKEIDEENEDLIEKETALKEVIKEEKSNVISPLKDENLTISQPVYQSRRKKALEELKNWNDNNLENKISFEEVKNILNSEDSSTSHFGDLDPKDARILFAKETEVTPFGHQEIQNEIQEEELNESWEEPTSDTQFFEDLYENEDSSTIKSS